MVSLRIVAIWVPRWEEPSPLKQLPNLCLDISKFTQESAFSKLIAGRQDGDGDLPPFQDSKCQPGKPKACLIRLPALCRRLA